MTPPRIVTPERAKEIEARLAKATPGPWDNEGTSYVYGMVPGGRPNGEILLCCSIRVFQGTHEQDKRNAEFIAHSWEDLRDLLYTLAVEREENARLWQYHGGHMPECGGLDEVERRCACGYLQGEAYRELVEENARRVPLPDREALEDWLCAQGIYGFSGALLAFLKGGNSAAEESSHE